MARDKYALQKVPVPNTLGILISITYMFTSNQFSKAIPLCANSSNTVMEHCLQLFPGPVFK